MRLLRDRLFAAHGFAEFDVGDVDEQNHPPAFLGRPLADLQPAPVLQAIQQVFIGMPARLFGEQAVAHHQALDLAQAHASVDSYSALAPERLETTVEQHNALLGVEQHKCVGNAFDGIDQVLVRRFRTQAGFAEQMIAGLEFGHGLVQRIGALAHLLGQHDRMLEGRVRIIAASHPGFDPLDQRTIDALQFVVFKTQPGEFGLQFSDVLGHGRGQWQRR